MTVGLKTPENLRPIAGVRWGVCESGARYQGRPDFALMLLDEGAAVACVFTKNRFSAAPVQVAQAHLNQAKNLRALMINAGNANAGTGAAGLADTRETCNELAAHLSCAPEQILPFSTGVIAERLNMPALLSAMPKALESPQADHWLAASNAIMTTDTIAKGTSKQIVVDGKTISITGIAKGSGMIRPDMATMLAYFATDAKIASADLDLLLKEAVAESFHCITVDGDTSTNDACALVATGQSSVELTPRHPAWVEFKSVVTGCFVELAQAIVRDAEGIKRLLEINVCEAKSTQEARQIAFTVAHSPLVKTALFAGDPNWGRILAAVGRSGVDDLDVTQISLTAGDVALLTDGEIDPQYQEKDGARVFSADEVSITIRLARGENTATIWTSDLSYDYVRINAEYRS